MSDFRFPFLRGECHYSYHRKYIFKKMWAVVSVKKNSGNYLLFVIAKIFAMLTCTNESSIIAPFAHKYSDFCRIMKYLFRSRCILIVRTFFIEPYISVVVFCTRIFLFQPSQLSYFRLFSTSHTLTCSFTPLPPALIRDSRVGVIAGLAMSIYLERLQRFLLSLHLP